MSVKICESCGNEFQCDVAGACWCKALPKLEKRPGNFKECLCPNCLLGEPDFYLEGEAMVFTAAAHLKRGSCCGSGCRHCPWTSTKT